MSGKITLNKDPERAIQEIENHLNTLYERISSSTTEKKNENQVFRVERNENNEWKVKIKTNKGWIVSDNTSTTGYKLEE